MNTTKFFATAVTALSVVGSITLAYAQTTAPPTMPGQTTETMPTHPAQPGAANPGTSGTTGTTGTTDTTDTTGNTGSTSGTTSGSTTTPPADSGMTTADQRAPIADRN